MRLSRMRTSTITLSIILTLVAVNIHYVYCEKTDDKRRHRHLFQRLTAAESSAQTISGQETSIQLVDTKRNSNNAPHTLLSESNGDVDQTTLGSSDSFLTLTLMGKFRKTWCKTEPLTQIIRAPGCISRRIMNRFCYGQCNSFFIPRTIKKKQRPAAFKSCGYCQPKKSHTIRVTLQCPGRKKGYRHKKIEIVKQCRCMATNVS